MAVDLSQPKIIDPVKNATIGNTNGEVSVEKIDNVYMSRDKSGVISDFEIWKSKIVEIRDSSLNGAGSNRGGVKSYMNNYAFISFGSKDIGFGANLKNEFVSGGDIGGLLADPDQWKVPTTKNIIEWSKKNKDERKSNKPFSVISSKNQGAMSMGVVTNGNDAIKLEEDTNQINVENNQQFSSGGNIQGIGNFDYDWKDFVFCKNYGKIPNNRLLTLRRYKLPVLDNGTVGAKEDLAKLVSNEWGGEASGQTNEEWATSDSARALTYFGEGTENSLSGLFGFTVGLNWIDRTTPSENPKYNNNISTDGANFLSDPVDYLQILKDLGISGGVNSNIERMITAGIVNNTLKSRLTAQGFNEKQNADFIIANSLNNDPFQNGWAYRILGPVNVLLQTKSRARGLKFDGGGINLTFEYDMTQIGTMNPKNAILDIIANMLSLTTNSGSFWGGEYRFKRDLTNVPLPDDLLNQLENMASGGGVSYNTIVNSFIEDIKGKVGEITDKVKIEDLRDIPSKLDGVLTDLQKVIFGSDLVKANLENEKKQKEAELSQFKDGTVQYIQKNKELATINKKLENVNDGKGINFDALKDLPGGDTVARVLLNNGILQRNGDVKTLAKNLMMIKPLITGEPVGEWHLTVGNPMQPIAMIGNLVCTGMTMSLSEELGYDDFPTSIKFKVTLDHGRDRDKGDIESMFNMGQGRLYLNIKGATPWETGFSTRSSDNDNMGTNEEYRNPDGTYGNSNKTGNEQNEKLRDSKRKDGESGNPLNNSTGSDVDMETYTNETMSSGVDPSNGIPTSTNTNSTQSKPFSVIIKNN